MSYTTASLTNASRKLVSSMIQHEGGIPCTCWAADEATPFHDETCLMRMWGRAAYAIATLDNELRRSNAVLRSMDSIIQREGKAANWSAFMKTLERRLNVQHRLMFPDQYAPKPMPEPDA